MTAECERCGVLEIPLCCQHCGSDVARDDVPAVVRLVLDHVHVRYWLSCFHCTPEGAACAITPHDAQRGTTPIVVAFATRIGGERIG